jgi:hypothetical protein
MLWEDSIFGKVRNQDWLDVGNQVPTRPNDPIDGLFGDEKTDNITARWESLAAEYQLPVMAQFHGFDTEAKTTFRVPIDNHNIEKGLIKVKINQSERLRTLMRSGVQGDQALYDYVLNDGIRLADQVVTRTKVAKNELMATGKITIKENNLNLTVDYGVPEAQTQYSLDFSAGASSTIPEQIQAIIDAATEKGLTINGMLLSTKMLTKLRKDVNLQKIIRGNQGAGALLRRTEIEAFMADEWGITQVITNDLKYIADWSIDNSTGRPTTTSKKYYPDNKITFFVTNPGGRMGTGLWGDPPEVDMAGFNPVGASGVSPYVYIAQWMEKDPAVLWTKASGLFIPVLYNPESLFIATDSAV